MQILIIFSILVFFPIFSYAAGYEKTISWSAKWAGLAGASTGAVDGAESLVFNPAGLIKGKKREISLNLSPLKGIFRAPVVQSYNLETSNRPVVPLFAFLGKFNAGPMTALGLGVYSAGGSLIQYENVDFTRVNSNLDKLHPNVTSNIRFIEFSLGAAQKLNRNWSFGAAWRFTHVSFNSSAAGVLNNVVLAEVNLDNLKDNKASGFRLGAQYLNDHKDFGMGLQYRSQVDWRAHGLSSGTSESVAPGSAPTALIGGGTISVENSFPRQISLGLFKRFNLIELHSEYSWTNYSTNHSLKLRGNALYLGTSNVLSDTTQHWRDQHTFKLGMQYNYNPTLKFRLGSAIISQVTSSFHARPNATPPGLGYSVTAGIGKAWNNEKIKLDLAMDYSYAKGRNKMTTSGLRGNFIAKGTGLHTSFKLAF